MLLIWFAVASLYVYLIAQEAYRRAPDPPRLVYPGEPTPAGYVCRWCTAPPAGCSCDPPLPGQPLHWCDPAAIVPDAPLPRAFEGSMVAPLRIVPALGDAQRCYVLGVRDDFKPVPFSGPDAYANAIDYAAWVGMGTPGISEPRPVEVAREARRAYDREWCDLVEGVIEGRA